MRLLLLAAVSSLAACVDSSSISVEEEREMGLAVAEEATRQMPLLQDEPVVRFVQELGGHIVRRADTTGRDYEFRVVERHGLEQMAKARNTNTAVGLIYVLLGRVPGAAEQVALQVAGSAWMAKHSREAEREADRVAVVYLTRAGLDPRSMPRFFQRLLDEERTSPNELLAWFSTHPLTEQRIADTEAMITTLPSAAVQHASRDLP
jgi:predicted Zn-dependent protease